MAFPGMIGVFLLLIVCASFLRARRRHRSVEALRQRRAAFRLAHMGAYANRYQPGEVEMDAPPPYPHDSQPQPSVMQGEANSDGTLPPSYAEALSGAFVLTVPGTNQQTSSPV